MYCSLTPEADSLRRALFLVLSSFKAFPLPKYFQLQLLNSHHTLGLETVFYQFMAFSKGFEYEKNATNLNTSNFLSPI